MKEKLEKLLKDGEAKISEALSEAELKEVKSSLLGKQSVFTEIMKEMPSGFSIRPSMPDRKNRGRKQAMMIRVEFNMGIRTSREAS